MMTIIESNVMVNPLNDSHTYKRVEKDNSIQTSKDVVQDKVNSTSVNLSETSVQLMHLKEAILDAPSVNKERVAFLRNELQNGNYQIQSKNIARKMIADIEMA